MLKQLGRPLLSRARSVIVRGRAALAQMGIAKAGQDAGLSALFDGAHIERRYPGSPMSLEQYMDQGSNARIDPNPLFDTRFYCAQLRVPLKGTITPLQHYLREGAALGLSPSALFDSQFYLRQYPDVARAGVNPLAHFLQYGMFEGRMPIDLKKGNVAVLEQEALRLHAEDPASPLPYLYLAGLGCDHPDLLGAREAFETNPADATAEHICAVMGGIYGRHPKFMTLSMAKALHYAATESASPATSVLAYRLLLLIGQASEATGDLRAAVAVYDLACATSHADDAIKTYTQAVKNMCVRDLYAKGESDEAWRLYHLWNQEDAHAWVELTLSTVRDHCTRKGDFYQEFRPQRPIDAPQLAFLNRQFSPQAERGDLVANAQYLALVRDANGFSSSNIVVVGETALHDASMHRRGRDIVLADSLDGRHPIVVARNGDRVLAEFPKQPDALYSSGLMMFGVGTKNYGHWLTEFLPRMLTYNDDACPSDMPIIIDEGMPGTHIEALALLNTKRRAIITMPLGQVAHFETLGMSPVPAFFPFDMKQGAKAYDTIWPADVFAALKRKVLEAVEQTSPRLPKRSRRLFISRKAFTSRNLRNEHEIGAHLARLGFEVIYPEQLTFAEQVHAFTNAEIVVGSCSSAMSNCIFCDEKAIVIGLIHDVDVFNFGGYASFIGSGGANILFVQGNAVPNEQGHAFHASYTVPIASVDLALLRALSEMDHGAISPELAHIYAQVRSAVLAPLFDKAHVLRQPAPRLIALDDYLSPQGVGDISPNPLFDDGYYRSQLAGELPVGTTPLDHYVVEGASRGLKTSALFDTAFYAAQNPDVAGAAINPLAHFLQHGWREGRLPVPLRAVDLGAFREAVEALVQTASASPLAVMYRALLRCAEGNVAEAVALVREAAAKGDRRGMMQAVLAAVDHMEAHARPAEVLDAWRELLTVWPENLEARWRFGVLLREQGFLKEAEAEFHALMRAAPDPASRERARSAWQDLNSDTLRVRKLQDEIAIAHKRGDAPRARELVVELSVLRPPTAASKERMATALAEGGQSAHMERSASGIEASGTSRLLFLDTSYPSRLSSFRYGEFSEYLRLFPDSQIQSSVWQLRAFGETASFLDLAISAAEAEGFSLSQVKLVNAARSRDAHLVYTTFLNNAYAYWLGRSQDDVTPFAFTLYPGGGFVLDDAKSDAKLAALCGDKSFARVITTQIVTYRYLIEREFCPPEKILHIFGGIVPAFWHNAEAPFSRTYGDGVEARFNICFVAQRYSETGIEKGYDIFAALIREFADDPRMMFHVVGNWNREICDLSGAQNVIFHGIKQAQWFPDFYRTMDAIVSPNISGLEMSGTAGSFDGFPTTTCVEAGMQGAAMFLTDSLKMNVTQDGDEILKPGVDFELINRDIDDAASLLRRYLETPGSFEKLGLAGRQTLLRLFSHEVQMAPRIEMLRSLAASPGSHEVSS